MKFKSTKNRHEQQQQHESLKLPIALKHIHTQGNKKIYFKFWMFDFNP